MELPGEGRGAQSPAADRRRDDAHQPVLLLLGDLHRALQLQAPRRVDALHALRPRTGTPSSCRTSGRRDRARRLRRDRVHHASASTATRTCCARRARAAVLGVWVEKGMGLVIPGFVPSPLGEIVDYTPSFTEFCVSAAIWAAGALIFTLLLKAAVPIELGTLRHRRRPRPRRRTNEAPRAQGSRPSRCSSACRADSDRVTEHKAVEPPVASPNAIPDAPAERNPPRRAVRRARRALHRRPAHRLRAHRHQALDRASRTIRAAPSFRARRRASGSGSRAPRRSSPRT